jgi:hypothetical protein
VQLSTSMPPWSYHTYVMSSSHENTA